MKICANCGVELADDEQFCSLCDTPVALPQAPEDATDEPEPASPVDDAEPATEETEPSEQEPDAQEPEPQEPEPPAQEEPRAKPGERAMGALAYVLFFIPLIVGRGEFAKHHTNQSAVIFLGFVSSVAVAVIPYVGVVLGIIGVAFNLLCSIAGIVCALAGKKINLPVVGKFIILK